MKRTISYHVEPAPVKFHLIRTVREEGYPSIGAIVGNFDTEAEAKRFGEDLALHDE